ncbi:dynamin family protein [Bacillus licheniformis]|nr:dynamin family protein [Bacillus licheniformis]
MTSGRRSLRASSEMAEKEVYIALTGHYSAGKSSLLNALLQEEVLPTSPIPTSANLVLVRRGEMKTTLHTVDGRYAQMDGSYDKEKCRRTAGTAARLKWWKSGAFSGIAPQAVLIDTPGIDSTDDAHFYRRLRFFTRRMPCFMSCTTIMSIPKKM